jgi:hypothetical protein
MWPTETIRIVAQMPQRGVFLTGIENADPFVQGNRRNQLREAHDFYVHYESRLERIKQLGITWLRFGPPYSQTHIGPQHYDFSFADAVIEKCKKLDIEVIADLLHFGLPDWLHHQHLEEPYFQNIHFPVEFARYAETFARAYPHLKYYTPVNEPYVTALMSAKLGIWNEAMSNANPEDDRAFVRATANIAKAGILAREAIDRVWQEEHRESEPIYIQNESFEVALAMPESGREAEADLFNLRRFASLDLAFGHHDPKMEQYLLGQGLLESEYAWFMEHGTMRRTILGIDHYPWCIHEFHRDRNVEHDFTRPSRLFELIQEYWDRYPMPLLHTEVNGVPEHATKICQETYDALSRLRQEGYPVLGMGWFGDDMQVGWQSALTGDHAYDEYPVGLFYKGEQQPIAELYGELAKKGMPPFQYKEHRKLSVS